MLVVLQTCTLTLFLSTWLNRSRVQRPSFNLDYWMCFVTVLPLTPEETIRVAEAATKAERLPEPKIAFLRRRCH